MAAEGESMALRATVRVPWFRRLLPCASLGSAGCCRARPLVPQAAAVRVPWVGSGRAYAGELREGAGLEDDARGKEQDERERGAGGEVAVGERSEGRGLQLERE
eukprot:4814127-Prymnesium_polylepis.1